MAQKVMIELNQAAIRQQLLKSPEILEICRNHAEEIAERCGMDMRQPALYTVNTNCRESVCGQLSGPCG